MSIATRTAIHRLLYVLQLHCRDMNTNMKKYDFSGQFINYIINPQSPEYFYLHVNTKVHLI